MMKSDKQTGGLVYSTDVGRTCPECRLAIAQCVCGQAVINVSTDGVVRVSRETKGRKGKGVTLVQGLGLEAEPLTKLSKQIKATCGCGGTVKDGIIEVQGDHVDTVVAFLLKQGLKVKRAGGAS